jgi:hypothetical protein
MAGSTTTASSPKPRRSSRLASLESTESPQPTSPQPSRSKRARAAADDDDAAAPATADADAAAAPTTAARDDDASSEPPSPSPAPRRHKAERSAWSATFNADAVREFARLREHFAVDIDRHKLTVLDKGEWVEG